nr:zinc-binding dehydrogenase [Kineosporia mesophila]
MSALIARACGAEVSIAGPTPESLLFASTLGFDPVSTREHVDRAKGFDAVIDAAGGPDVPALAAELVDPGGRVVFIGLAAAPSRVDTRTLVLKDVTAVGVLSGSGALAGVVDLFAQGALDPRPLVAATVPLEGAAEVLAGRRPGNAGPGPKIHVDPRL